MKRIHNSNTQKQRGAVSLFVVIFTTLLVTTITIGFMQLMVKDQQQASYSDLSESAYDSAMAGVEDAKRALINCQGKATKECEEALYSGKCNALGAVLGNVSGAETKIKQSESDEKLEQGYTCVKISPDTKDFVGTITPGMNPVLVPLRGKDTPFNTIVVSWNQVENDDDTVDMPTAGSKELPPKGNDWPTARPALLRTQLINGKNSFELSDFDTSGFSNTLFLYPSLTGVGELDFSRDGRKSSNSGEPQLVTCNPDAPSGAYTCQVTLHIGEDIAPGSNTTFLSLAAFYNATDFKVELRNGGGDTVVFSGVQPEVDSTGRANSLFRRVISRVELNSTFNYPLSALETNGNLCKNFSITTEAGDYDNKCDPVPAKP